MPSARQMLRSVAAATAKPTLGSEGCRQSNATSAGNPLAAYDASALSCEAHHSKVERLYFERIRHQSEVLLRC